MTECQCEIYEVCEVCDPNTFKKLRDAPLKVTNEVKVTITQGEYLFIATIKPIGLRMWSTMGDIGKQADDSFRRMREEDRKNERVSGGANGSD